MQDYFNKKFETILENEKNLEKFFPKVTGMVHKKLMENFEKQKKALEEEKKKANSQLFLNPENIISLTAQRLEMEKIAEETNIKKKLEDKSIRVKIQRCFNHGNLPPAELALA